MVEWQLQWGKDEAFLLELQEDGREVKALEERPALTPAQKLAYEAFWLLSPSRQIAVGGLGGVIICGIPTTDILLYASAAGLDPLWFLRMIRVMDRAYIDHCEDKQKHSQEKKRRK